MTTGERIKELRKEKRMSQTELGQALHVSQQTVTSWETNRADPSSSALTALANYFDVTADYLLGMTNKRHEDRELSQNQKLVAYSIDPDTSDEERDAIIEMVQAAKKFRRRI